MQAEVQIPAVNGGLYDKGRRGTYSHQGHQRMTVGCDLPVCPPSFLQRMDPRWKLAGVLLAALALAFLRTWAPALAALMAALALVVLARLPLGWYLRRMAAALL